MTSKLRAAPSTEDAAMAAVDELNRRLARAQRRLTGITVGASVAAGLASAGWLLWELDGAPVAVRLVMGVFLAAVVATLAIGVQLVRVLLLVLKRGWVRELSRRNAVSAADVESFALPFGGPPARPGSGAPWSKAAPGAVALLVVVGVVGVFVGWESALRVACTVAAALTTAMFWGYLGFRAPR